MMKKEAKRVVGGRLGKESAREKTKTEGKERKGEGENEVTVGGKV